MRARRGRTPARATGVYRIRDRRRAGRRVAWLGRPIDAATAGVYAPRTTEDAYQEWWRDRPCEARQPTGGDAGTVPNPGRSSCEIRSFRRPFLTGRVAWFLGLDDGGGPPRWRPR